jgi:hypothetical protein
VIIKKEDYQMQRVEFLNPEAEVVKFEAEDVIATSPNEGMDFGGNLQPGGGDIIDADKLFPC